MPTLLPSFLQSARTAALSAADSAIAEPASCRARALRRVPAPASQGVPAASRGRRRRVRAAPLLAESGSESSQPGTLPVAVDAAVPFS